MKFSVPVSLLNGLFGAAAQAATLTVAVTDFESDAGRVNIYVYDNEDDWLGKNRAQERTLIVRENLANGRVAASFELEPGEYAVSVHHDDNDNGRMDTNFIGIPREPTGLSNGAVPKFGPPRYKDAVFALGEEGAEIEIGLID